MRDSVEMARLAEQLGQGFQARAFLTVAIAMHPDREDLRHHLNELKRNEASREGAGRSLADVLATEYDFPTGSPPSPGSPTATQNPSAASIATPLEPREG